MNDLKVMFLYENRNIGGIEIMTSHPDKYKVVWCYLYASRILDFLKNNLQATLVEGRQVTLYGNVRESLLHLFST